MRPPAPDLPDGFTVVLGRHVRILDGGRALVGGAPTRILYLTDTARRMLDGRRIRVTDDGTRALVDRLLEAGMADPVLGELPEHSVEVTFVVPTYGRPEALDRLLSSIDGGARVIVVDDRSPDPEPVARVTERHGARYTALRENVGPAGARNAGLALVETSYVAFVDTDVVVDEAVVPVLGRHFADPRVAVVAPRIAGLGSVREHTWIGRYEDARSSLDLGRFPATVRPRAPVGWVPSTFLLARVDALGDGFSPDMREGEDVDLIWRLVEQGWRVRYEPAVRVFHEHRETAGSWLSRKAFYGSSAAPLAARHGRKVAPAVLAPWSVGVLAAVLAQRRWSVPVAVGLSLIAAARIASRLGRSRYPMRVSIRLTAAGVGATLSQGTALLVRHWWPVTVLAAVFSRRVRRATIVAAVVDAAIEYRRTRPRLDPVRYGVARRLDDLAYGAGVWFSVVKARSVAALLPDIHRRG